MSQRSLEELFGEILTVAGFDSLEKERYLLNLDRVYAYGVSTRLVKKLPVGKVGEFREFIKKRPGWGDLREKLVGYFSEKVVRKEEEYIVRGLLRSIIKEFLSSTTDEQRLQLNNLLLGYGK